MKKNRRVVFYIVVVILVACFVVCGFFITQRPETIFLRGEDVTTQQMKTLKSFHLLDANETITYLHADEVFNRDARIVIVTNKNLVVYDPFGDPQRARLPFEHIKSIKNNNGRWSIDANVTLWSGKTFRFVLSPNKHGLDTQFFRHIRHKMPCPGGHCTASFAAQRKGFKTKIKSRLKQNLRYKYMPSLVDEPPSALFDRIYYNGPLGKMPAYMSPDPNDNKKHPIVIWRTGGWSNSIGAIAWSKQREANDQSAKQFREAGLLMMYPALRGSLGSTGQKEHLYGEVDDILAAIEHVSKLPYVDTKRIYLGGHSTGGTLVLLVAAAAKPGTLRAVFSFGPYADMADYHESPWFFDESDPLEFKMRSPGSWVSSIQTPTYIFEGEYGVGIAALEAASTRNPTMLKTYVLKTHDHFSYIRQLNAMIAQKIKTDTTPKHKMVFDVHALRPKE